MKRIVVFSFLILSVVIANAQEKEEDPRVVSARTNKPGNGDFIIGKNNPATAVKDQANTNTCWSFSTTSLIESQLLKNKMGMFDLSEMFTVRNMYMEKARNYILRQGHAQFGEGGLGHDVIRSIATYGAVPENIYSGLMPGQTTHDHAKMSKDLKRYLDSMLKSKVRPLPADWINGVTKILDNNLGPAPESFRFNGKIYTPLTFAKDAMNFKADDYVNITSFTHHPYYVPFIIEVPDNFSNGAYYNLPLNEMIDLAKNAINSGYSLMWDADVSNNGFRHKKGFALNFDQSVNVLDDSVNVNATEQKWDAAIRQRLFEDLVTEDDHLMHITGIEKSQNGKTFFIVKNSWGNSGPGKGYINVSESYFAINTISLVVPKAALTKAMLDKLKIQ